MPGTELCAGASDPRDRTRRSTLVLPAREHPRPGHPRETGAGEWRGLVFPDAFALAAPLVFAAVVVVRALRHDAAAVDAVSCPPPRSRRSHGTRRSLRGHRVDALAVVVIARLIVPGRSRRCCCSGSLLGGMAKHSSLPAPHRRPALHSASTSQTWPHVRAAMPTRWAEAPSSATPPKTVARAPPARRRSASRREGFAATRAFVSASNRRSSMNASLQIPIRGGKTSAP